MITSKKKPILWLLSDTHLIADSLHDDGLAFQHMRNTSAGKDLDYLSDMFEWNYGTLKKVNAGITCVKDEEIKDILKEGYNLFKNNLNVILSILREGGQNE